MSPAFDRHKRVEPRRLGVQLAARPPRIACAAISHAYSSDVGKEVVDESRKCPMCGSTTWVLLDGHSTLQALEGGLEALAYSCDTCGFIRWHRMDKAEPQA